ncbi:MAG: sigma-70 family RNA polymerase sigma factor [Planctomycetota bacterium]
MKRQLMQQQTTSKKPQSSTQRTSASRGLSLSDLEVPVRPLLNKDEEAVAGRKVRAALARLGTFLPRHLNGYAHYLRRMEQVTAGGGSMFSWLSLRQTMSEDANAARSALEKAQKQIEKSPKRAMNALEKGIQVLTSYPLDPETLYQWSRLSAKKPLPKGALGQHERSQKIHRIVQRAVRSLEEARDSLVLPNFRLVLKDVFRYHPLGMRHSDLFQEGVLGLHKAVFRFDPGRGTRFSTYATYWIRQSIRKALIDKARVIRVPQAVQEELRKEEPKLKTREADRVRRLMSETMLFSAAENEDAGDRNTFVVSDPKNSVSDEELHTKVIPRAVSDALGGLDTRSREVLQRRFGLAGGNPQTLEEIGRLMSLSRERIRQIEHEALRRMQRVTDLKEVYEDLGAVDPLGVGARA